MKKEIIDYLLAVQKPHTYRPGEIIFSQGDPANEFYYIVKGLSLTYTIFEDGRERNILVTWPGRIFGASTFFEKAVRRASAIAVKQCEIIIITPALYQQLCEMFQDCQAELTLEISKDLGVLFDELADSSVVNSEIRVARFLCRRLANGQHIGTEEKPILNYTQDFISDVLGISRMSVSQALSKFSDYGWLTTGYGKICLLDTHALRMFAYN